MSHRQFGIASDLLRQDHVEGQSVQLLDPSIHEQDAERISQEQLRELLRLRRLADQYKKLRTQIRRAIQEGARIEPGMVGAYVRECKSKQLSAAKLRALLGDDHTSAILNQIEPTTVTQLILWEELSQI